ncbi:MAG: hypothetical protein AAFQ94_23005 [Bacteroidota bacterium]|mgnify:CR=1 FL=1
MNTTVTNLESEILSSVHQMSRDQKKQVLDYVDNLANISQSKEKYRRDAMKQIREALATI